MDNIVVIEGEVSLDHVICGDIDLSSSICGEIDKVIYVDSARNIYHGSYEVTPMVNSEVTLETEGLYMEDDLTVLRVPYLETANLSGGNTAWIGEEVNG